VYAVYRTILLTFSMLFTLTLFTTYSLLLCNSELSE